MIDDTSLNRQNPWWIKEELVEQDEKILEYQSQSYRYIPPFLLSYPCDHDAILTLRGPRQIGKSTAVKLLIRKLLLEIKVPAETIFFFSCDRVEDFNELYGIMTQYLERTRALHEKKRLFIFLDEISFVREWQRAMKSLADEGRLKNTTILLTGSNLLDLKTSSEKMPGRRGKQDALDFELLPLSFRDFVKTVAPRILEMPLKEKLFSQAKIDRLLDDFLLTGGFPTSFNEYYRNSFIPSYVYKLYTSWIEGDINKIGRSEKILYQLTNKILDTFTTPISWHKIGKEAGGIAHTTVFDYVETLEKMYVLSVCEWFDISRKSILFRKNKKIYFLDPLIFQCFLSKKMSIDDSPFQSIQSLLKDPSFKAALVENMVGEYLRRKHKTVHYTSFPRAEIDFITHTGSALQGFEVKYRNHISGDECQKIRTSLPEHIPLTIITKTKEHHSKDISFIPASIFLLEE